MHRRQWIDASVRAIFRRETPDPATNGGDMATNPVIRPAGPDDAAAIAAIHAASWRVTYRGLMPDAYLDSLTADARRPMWDQVLTSQTSRVDVQVLDVEGAVAGFVWTGPCLGNDHPASTGELYAIYVRPGLEGQGLGRRLLIEGESAMARHGFTDAILHVLRDNHHARRFYEAAGWETDGIDQVEEIFSQPVIELVYRRTLTNREAENVRQS
jgi:ribosomal protein S18 acetylase RimI-like enzyme